MSRTRMSYSAGSSSFNLYCTRDTFNTSRDWVQTITESLTLIPNAATTVAKEHTFASNVGFFCPADHKLIARTTDTSTTTAIDLAVSGKLFPRSVVPLR